MEIPMPATSAERMRTHRARRRVEGLREIRLSVPDARTEGVRASVAKAVAQLDHRAEADILDWIEAVSQFDDHPAR
jgi:hypothetical protein